MWYQPFFYYNHNTYTRVALNWQHLVDYPRRIILKQSSIAISSLWSAYYWISYSRCWRIERGWKKKKKVDYNHLSYALQTVAEEMKQLVLPPSRSLLWLLIVTSRSGVLPGLLPLSILADPYHHLPGVLHDQLLRSKVFNSIACPYVLSSKQLIGRKK